MRIGQYSTRARAILLSLAFAALAILATACGGPTAVDEDALTAAYVEKALKLYADEGLDAVVSYYSSQDSIEDERYLVVVDADTYVALALPFTEVIGGVLEFLAPGGPFHGEVAKITAEGHWFEALAINPITLQQEPARYFAVPRDGLLFVSAHFTLIENVEASTREYVAKAIARYESDGKDATAAHYNSRDSMDGQFYLFLVDENDLYAVHPIFPGLIGTDIKDVVATDGYELGKEIARATEDGLWVKYLWPNPLTGREESKVTWAVRHDGKIFASGYYTGVEDATELPWTNADPQAYTKDYVDRAIERYRRDGLESFKAYYNSVASFEGQWYLFVMDANDDYIVHPVFPSLIGTDVKDVVGSDGYRLGEEIAKATAEGIWLEYLWPHPITMDDATKVAYAVRHDDMIFASGYYINQDDAPEYTKEYVREAIERYERDGLEAMVAYYNSRESHVEQWFLTVIGRDDTFIVHGLFPNLIGTKAEDFVDTKGKQVGAETMKATEEGIWVQSLTRSVTGSGSSKIHIWAVRHDGMVFMSLYYDAPE